MITGLQVVRENGEYNLVHKTDGVSISLLGKAPSNFTYQKWEEDKYDCLSRAAAWFEGLPERGYFVYQGKEYIFGNNVSRRKTVDSFGMDVYCAWEWLRAVLRNHGWQVK